MTYLKSTKQFDRQIDTFMPSATLINAIHLFHHIRMRTWSNDQTMTVINWFIIVSAEGPTYLWHLSVSLVRRPPSAVRRPPSAVRRPSCLVKSVKGYAQSVGNFSLHYILQSYHVQEINICVHHSESTPGPPKMKTFQIIRIYKSSHFLPVEIGLNIRVSR